MSTIIFVVGVYDLTDGHEVAHKEYDHYSEARKAYLRAARNWETPLSKDDPYPFGVLLFTESGTILGGFGDCEAL